MTLKEEIEVKEAVRITAYLQDFDGDVEKWKDSFYQVWRLQLTWSFAYDIKLLETRRSGVYLSMVIKPSYESSVLETLPGFGYREIKPEKENIGVLEYVSDEFLDQYIDVLYVD